jgi:hypothetical protein
VQVHLLSQRRTMTAAHANQRLLSGRESLVWNFRFGSTVPVPDVRKLPLAGRTQLTHIAAAATSVQDRVPAGGLAVLDRAASEAR